MLEPASTKINVQFGNYKLDNHLTRMQQTPAILQEQPGEYKLNNYIAKLQH